MATIGTMNPTLLDVQSRLDPNNSIAQIIEMMNQTNEIVQDMTMVEGNLPTGHKTTVRTGLPEATWRMLNYGVKPSKSKTKQVTDTCGMLEAYAEIDKSLADLNGNSATFRLSEDYAFLEAMNQEWASTLFYGDENSPEKFVGLAARYNDKSAESGKNIIDAGGTANLTSIYLVVWGKNTVHGIYPKGSTGGISHEDLGVQTLTDPDGGLYQGYRTHYKLDTGLTVRDWRYVVRIANIDVTALTKDAKSGADLINLMIRAEELIPNMNVGRAAWYMNPTVRTFLRMQKNEAHKYTISEDQEMGHTVVRANGIPVRKTDALLSTEARVQ